jgi:hypothetical protein
MKSCTKCNSELHDLNWHSARQKKCHYICNGCHKNYNGRYYQGNYIDIRKRAGRSYNKENRKYGSKQWATQYLSSKRSWDKKKGLQICDLTTSELLSFITLPCTYCEDASGKIGLDRVDNTKGHIKSNIVPCCPTCNSARMDNLTFEEMKILGQTIKLIKETRRASKCV